MICYVTFILLEIIYIIITYVYIVSSDNINIESSKRRRMFPSIELIILFYYKIIILFQKLIRTFTMK